MDCIVKWTRVIYLEHIACLAVIQGDAICYFCKSCWPVRTLRPAIYVRVDLIARYYDRRLNQDSFRLFFF